MAAAELLGTVDERVPAIRADFDGVVRLYWPKIYRFVLASLRDPDAADNLTQDCFLRAYTSRDRFRNECSLDTWLMQIAVNLVRDHVKNRRLQFWRRTLHNTPPLQEILNLVGEGEQSLEQAMLLQERINHVWMAAGSLTLKQRTVFLLRFVEDMELPEIARATGMKVGTVKSHLFRALQTVRESAGGKPCTRI